MTKSKRLAALDREFDSPVNCATGKMKVAEYESRRRAIEAEPDPTPAPVLAPPSKSVEFVSKTVFQKVLEGIGKLMKERLASLESRVASAERVATFCARPRAGACARERYALLRSVERRRLTAPAWGCVHRSIDNLVLQRSDERSTGTELQLAIDGQERTKLRKQTLSKGTVKKWFDAKGYGFIENDGGGPNVFVHQNQILGEGRKTLVEGQRVEFDVADGIKGFSANNVRPI